MSTTVAVTRAEQARVSAAAKCRKRPRSAPAPARCDQCQRALAACVCDEARCVGSLFAKPHHRAHHALTTWYADGSAAAAVFPNVTGASSSSALAHFKLKSVRVAVHAIEGCIEAVGAGSDRTFCHALALLVQYMRQCDQTQCKHCVRVWRERQHARGSIVAHAVLLECAAACAELAIKLAQEGLLRSDRALLNAIFDRCDDTDYLERGTRFFRHPSYLAREACILRTLQWRVHFPLAWDDLNERMCEAHTTSSIAAPATSSVVFRAACGQAACALLRGGEQQPLVALDALGNCIAALCVRGGGASDEDYYRRLEQSAQLIAAHYGAPQSVERRERLAHLGSCAEWANEYAAAANYPRLLCNWAEFIKALDHF